MKNDSKYGSLRKHQARAIVVARELAAKKRHQKVVVAGITPGGGKTLMASLFANELADEGSIDRVLVVVPNDPLRQQMIEKFDDRARGLDRFLRPPDRNGSLPGTGRPFGQVVTYQRLALTKDAKKLAKWCADRKTLVVFDECHHMRENKAWEKGATQVVNAAALVLCMSGTLWRWDEERIPFVNYGEDQRALVDIRYSRKEALAEEAVLPIEFRFVDGTALYDHANVPHQTTLSRAPEKEWSRALKTALTSREYTEEFLVSALRDWERYRAQYYPSSAIVVCHDQKSARRALGIVKANFGEYSPALSLHNEPNADRAIKKFRAGEHSILVTVKKAYEGLDVPNASHLVYLGDIRSTPFLDQVIARVTRHNPKAPLPWSHQRGYVYVPDDPRMRAYVSNMLDEQAEYYRDKERGDVGMAAERKRSTFRPSDASVTDVRFGFDGKCLTPEENIGVREIEVLYPHVRLLLSDKLDMAQRMNLIPMAPGASDAAAE